MSESNDIQEIVFRFSDDTLYSMRHHLDSSLPISLTGTATSKLSSGLGVNQRVYLNHRGVLKPKERISYLQNLKNLRLWFCRITVKSPCAHFYYYIKIHFTLLNIARWQVCELSILRLFSISSVLSWFKTVLRFQAY